MKTRLTTKQQRIDSRADFISAPTGSNRNSGRRKATPSAFAQFDAGVIDPPFGGGGGGGGGEDCTVQGNRQQFRQWSFFILTL